MTLTRMGLDAHCAATSAEALAMLQNHTYELCLTDMRLTDGDGLAVLEYVSKHCHPNMPVAVITAHGSAENAVAALKAGAFDYLAKPVSLNQLRTLVRSALNSPVRRAPQAGERQGPPGFTGADRHIRGHAGDAGADRPPRAQPGPDPHQRRVGQRQGARCASGASQGFAPGRSVRRRQLRSDTRKPDGIRVLRLPQRRVYRRGRGPRRLFPGRERRARCSSTRWPTCRCRCR